LGRRGSRSGPLCGGDAYDCGLGSSAPAHQHRTHGYMRAASQRSANTKRRGARLWLPDFCNLFQRRPAKEVGGVASSFQGSDPGGCPRCRKNFGDPPGHAVPIGTRSCAHLLAFDRRQHVRRVGDCWPIQTSVPHAEGPLDGCGSDMRQCIGPNIGKGSPRRGNPLSGSSRAERDAPEAVVASGHNPLSGGPVHLLQPMTASIARELRHRPASALGSVSWSDARLAAVVSVRRAELSWTTPRPCVWSDTDARIR